MCGWLRLLLTVMGFNLLANPALSMHGVSGAAAWYSLLLRTIHCVLFACCSCLDLATACCVPCHVSSRRPALPNPTLFHMSLIAAGSLISAHCVVRQCAKHVLAEVVFAFMLRGLHAFTIPFTYNLPATQLPHHITQHGSSTLGAVTHWASALVH